MKKIKEGQCLKPPFRRLHEEEKQLKLVPLAVRSSIISVLDSDKGVRGRGSLYLIRLRKIKKGKACISFG